MSLVSIIIPTYNSEKFLNRTIISVVNQTYQDWELIIVDDFSKDSTREIIESWKTKDKRIRSIFLNDNSGSPAHPKNIGLKNADGEFIAFLDHDDEWLPEKLERQINFLKDENNKDYGFVTCDFIIDISGEKYAYITPVYEPKDQLINLLKNNFVYTCSSIIVKKEIFKKIGKFDEKLKSFDDWDLYIRIIEAGYPVGVISKKLFIWYSQKTSAGKKLQLIENVKEQEYILNKHKSLFLFFRDAYAKNLRSLGILYCLSGKFEIGRKNLLNAFNLGYQPCLTMILFLISFLHNKYIFKNILYIRKKNSRNPFDKM